MTDILLHPKTSADVATIFKKQREISKRGLSGQYDNTTSCWSFYNADQMSYTDQIQFEDTFGRRKRAMVSFNKVQQNVDSVVGFMAQNRRRAKFLAHVPLDQGQDLYSRNMNSLYEFHRENVNADQLETDQDLCMMVNGYGVTDTELSYVIGNSTTLPNGEITKALIDPLCSYWEPSCNTKNMTTAKWAGYWKDFELSDALNLFQGSTQDDFEQVSEDDPSDTGYVFNPYGGIYDKIKLMNTVEWTSKESEMVRVYNHQWMEYETFYKVENPLYLVTDPLDAMFIKLKLEAIKSSIKLPGDTEAEDMFSFEPLAEIITCDEATKRKLVKELNVTAIPFKRKVFYTAVISGTHVFTWFKSVCQQGFSIKFKTGTWNRDRKCWMGMVNGMMEPARYYNKALTELMFIIASTSKGGVMIEEDAVEDIADFESKYARTDAVMTVAAGAITQGKIQDKARPALPTGLEGILQICDANIVANGVDPSFLGNLDKEDQSGLLFKRRIRQVTAKLGRYMDSITLYQKDDARLNADLIRVWVQNNQGETVRITGEDGSQEFMVLVEDMLAPEYDVSIQEAYQSSDEKQETAIMLGGFADKMLLAGDMAAGKALLAESLPFMRLDGDVRGRLAKILAPTDQVDPQQFALMQAQMEEMSKLIQSGHLEKTQSETQKNLAIAAKTMKDADLTDAQLPKIGAETIRTLEEAKRTAAETDKLNEDETTANI